MALTLFRRHTSACTKQYAPSNRSGKDCRCMFHVEGGLGAEFIRQGTGTRSWPQALGAVRRAERLGVWEKLTPNDAVESSPGTVKKPVAEAIVEYLEDCASVQGEAPIGTDGGQI